MDSEQGTTEQLIERARRGDRSAQSQLWHLHRRWVAAIILAHRPRSIDVEDLMQEVAVKLIDRLDTLREPAAFRPWLRQIVLNICRGAARSLRTTISYAESDRPDDNTLHTSHCAPMPAREAVEEEAVDCRDEARRLLDQALTLPPEYREPLLLRCVRSMSYQQISDILDIPITTVETRLARARRMLREELGESDHRQNGSIR